MLLSPRPLLLEKKRDLKLCKLQKNANTDSQQMITKSIVLLLQAQKKNKMYAAQNQVVKSYKICKSKQWNRFNKAHFDIWNKNGNEVYFACFWI